MARKKGKMKKREEKREKKKQVKIKSDTKRIIIDIATRYLILLLASSNSFWIFYFLLTPATLQATAFLLKFFYPVKVYGNAMLLKNEIIISMVKACVAASAYYLFLILNLTTAGIKFSKRILIFLFDISLFFVLNIARIAILAIMQLNNLAFFDITHKIFWYGISTAYVVLIWLATIKIFKIRAVPVYSDVRFLLNEVRKRR